jgi:hypothetical protein
MISNFFPENLNLVAKYKIERLILRFAPTPFLAFPLCDDELLQSIMQTGASRKGCAFSAVYSLEQAKLFQSKLLKKELFILTVSD